MQLNAVPFSLSIERQKLISRDLSGYGSVPLDAEAADPPTQVYMRPRIITKPLKRSLLAPAMLLMMSLLLGSAIWLLSWRATIDAAASNILSVEIDEESEGDHPQYLVYDSSDTLLASGLYEKNINGSGWQYLRVIASDLPTDRSSDSLVQSYLLRMRAIGHLEGYMTCKDITAWYTNFYSGLFDGSDPSDEMVDFLLDNHSWMTELASQHWRHSEHWLAVRGFLEQLDGMLAGHIQGCPGTESFKAPVYLPSLKKRPSLIHFLLMNSLGDIYQLGEKFDWQHAPPSEDLPDSTAPYFPAMQGSDPHNSARVNPKKALLNRRKRMLDSDEDVSETAERISLHRMKDHCSAIVKLLPDGSDVLFAHNTWDDFQMMGPRSVKFISSPLLIAKRDSDGPDYVYRPQMDSVNRTKQLHHEVYFTSSPGLLTSVDDFYTMTGRANLAVTETSLDIFNKGLFALIHSESLLSWMRALVSNRLAVSGETWAQLFNAYHSGTYANQWVVLNLDLFTPGQDPARGFLVVVEEVPGYIHYADMTAHLIMPGYWASYNNPFFDDINILAGYLDACMLDSSMCYATDPRAMIFRERQSSVTNISSLQSLMQYNRFQTDPLSLNDSCNAIACRADLQLQRSEQYPFGAIDNKISSARMSHKTLRDASGLYQPIIFAKLGPSGEGQEPFCWSRFDSKRNVRGKRFSHVGQPDCFTYDWQQFPPPSQ